MNITDLSLLRQREIECNFAACVMINPLEALRTCGWLDSSDLSEENVRKLWQTVKDRISPTTDSETATMIGTQTALEVIGPDAIAWSYNTMTASPSAYADEIARRAYISRLSQGVAPLVNAIREGDDQKARDVIQQLASQERRGVVRLSDAIQVADEFAALVKAGNRSVPSYIPKFDQATGGFERQTLTVLAARPSIGKTALAFQEARNIAHAGNKVWFFSLEMSKASLWARAACPLIGTTWRDVRAGKLTNAQTTNLLAESYSLAAAYSDRLVINDEQQSTETIWRAVMQHHPDFVIVDHIRLCKDTHTSETKRMGVITQRLKDLAKAANIPVLALAQLNRQSEIRGKADKRPQLADLRDSGEIEENADLVLMLHRESENNVLGELTELWVRKFRDGPRDALIRLSFNPKKEWFE